jgi:hypothetical protein
MPDYHESTMVELASKENVSLGGDAALPSYNDALGRLSKARQANPNMPLSAALPLIFKLKGKPYSIANTHFLFEHEYATHNIPRRQIDKAGRQLSKSTNKAAGGIIRAASHPYYNMLSVTPLFEQIRKFSNNYVRPFLKESIVRARLMDESRDQQVLQRTLGNGSNLFYNYATNSADRIRGTSCDEVAVDELQDFDIDVLPVIQSCLDASPYKLERYSGTPKTFDNPIEVYWEQSSQGIWHIPCEATGCKHVNVCCVDGDILNMIGDNTQRKDGSPRTLICAKCGGPLDSRGGYFIHRFPERRLTFSGYHEPQIVFPMHYNSPLSWDKILDTLRNKPKYIFYNEVLGESYDTGQKLMTIKDLTAAATAKYVRPSQLDKSRYNAVMLGVDWGGKGREKTTDTEDFISNTALALAGINVHGIVDVMWGYATPYIADHFQEASIVKEAAATAGVNYICHDFGGAGNIRESILTHMGWPLSKLCPFTYMAQPNQDIINFSPSGEAGPRNYWSLDKARSLLMLCELIKCGKVRFAPYEGPMQHLMNDFLSIFEEIRDNPRGRGMNLVHRIPKRHDDFVHAVNYAVMGLYHHTQFWPDMAQSWHKMRTMVASDGTTESTNRQWLPDDVL